MTGPRPDRVFMVCTEAPPEIVGGLGRYVERMMAALRAAGTPVLVLAATGQRGWPSTSTDGDVTVRRIRTPGVRAAPAPRVVEQLLRLVGLLIFNVVATARILVTDRGAAGSVVAVHDWMACLTGLLCRHLGRRAVVFHVHSNEVSATPGQPRTAVATVLAALEDAMARCAGAIVVPSLTMRDQLLARGWPAAKLRVVPHGYEVPELTALTELPAPAQAVVRSTIRERYLPGGAGALVVFAGRLSAHKGVNTLLRAVPLLPERRPLCVVFAGTGSPRTGDNADVAGLIATLDIADRVRVEFRFFEPTELFGHFLAADVCAFPSTYEPFGLVAIEAMALGRPVVVGPGYSPEVVATGAVRCAQDDPAVLAAAIGDCLSDQAAADTRGRAAATFVRQTYVWARTVALTLAVYAEAHQPRPEPARL